MLVGGSLLCSVNKHSLLYRIGVIIAIAACVVVVAVVSQIVFLVFVVIAKKSS